MRMRQQSNKSKNLLLSDNTRKSDKEKYVAVKKKKICYIIKIK